ncbi:hypothetical protein [Streptosporangium sp. NPDC000396]|uniref:hypothetical protein n=1 Tax=Streptosporangium sp. NPDC000396 TaxID=3366185 RepID=UPI0036A7DD61
MKRIAVGLLSAAVGSSLLLTAGTASAERTALSVHIDNVAPNPVVVQEDRDTTVTVEVRTTEATRVELRLRPASGQFRTQEAHQPKLVHDGDLWRFTADFDDSDVEGRWLAIADAYGKDGKKVTDQVNFSVEHEEQGKTETRLTSFYANPDSVRKGRWITFTGRLQSHEDDSWQGLKDEEVGIYFRPRGSSGWKFVTSADTGWRGKFQARVRASKSGEYRAVFEGNDEFEESTSRSDWVRVSRW